MRKTKELSIVHTLYSDLYNQANNTQKRFVLADARTAQSLVDAIYAQRKVLLGVIQVLHGLLYGATSSTCCSTNRPRRFKSKL